MRLITGITHLLPEWEIVIQQIGLSFEIIFPRGPILRDQFSVIIVAEKGTMGVGSSRMSGVNNVALWTGIQASPYIPFVNIAPIVTNAEKVLLEALHNEYFNKKNIELVEDKIVNLFDMLRINGIKIALNTEYPKDLQNQIINGEFNLTESKMHYLRLECNNLVIQ